MPEAERPSRREHPTVDERSTLESFLDDYRDIVVRKVSGLSDSDARRRLVPSPTTVGGLIKHLRWAEYGWFDQLLPQRHDDNRRQHDRSWEFEFLPEESLTALITEYQAQCEESRRVAARYPLDHVVPHRRFGSVSLRLDICAHDRGDRPPHRATRHLARTTRRRNRIRRLDSQCVSPRRSRAARA